MKKILFPLFTYFLLFLFSCTQSGKTVKPENVGLSTDSLDLACAKMQGYIDNGKLAGISVMVLKNGKVVLKRNFGYTDIGNQKPVEDNTIFRIFSMTKPITTAALMTLFDEGKFELDDKVSKYIPEFAGTQVYNAETKKLEPQIHEMTIRNLLTHTSGLTYGWDQNAYVDSLYRVSGAGGWNETLGEKMKILAGLPLKNQPGTKWEYSLAIDVAGYLVEVLSGMTLDKYFKTKIFEPLKMEDTGFYVPEEKHSRLALLYNPDKDGKLKGPDNPDTDRFKKPAILFSGGGGLVSTINDYSRFAQMLLNGGELNGIRILKKSTVDLIMSNQLPEGVSYENDGGYGLGGSFNIENGQYGWSGAASTHFVVDPENEMVVLAFTQFMPFDIGYALEFSDKVQHALLK